MLHVHHFPLSKSVMVLIGLFCYACLVIGQDMFDKQFVAALGSVASVGLAAKRKHFWTRPKWGGVGGKSGTSATETLLVVVLPPNAGPCDDTGISQPNGFHPLATDVRKCPHAFA